MKEEMIDIVDENDNVVDTVPRKKMRKKNLRHRTSFILVFNPKGEVLVTKRTKTKDVYPGLYELFRGGTVVHEETFEQTAYRELEEEVGIRNVPIKVLFKFSYKDDVQNCMGAVYKCVYDGEIKIQKSEVESYFFISIRELKEMVEKNPEEFTGDGLYTFKKYLEEYQ